MRDSGTARTGHHPVRRRRCPERTTGRRDDRDDRSTAQDLGAQVAELLQRVETLETALVPHLPVTGALGRLSAAEHAIAGRILAGRTNEQIARDLHYSPKTVEWALTKVYRKLKVRSRTELAVRLARESAGLAASM